MKVQLEDREVDEEAIEICKCVVMLQGRVLSFRIVLNLRALLSGGLCVCNHSLM
jgi:hypothetical protein